MRDHAPSPQGTDHYMPLYEYQCQACGHRFEVIQKFSDAPIATCPRCDGVVHKLQSAPAFQFKGTGWYITDYAKKDGKTHAKGDETSATKGESGKGSAEASSPTTGSETKSSPASDSNTSSSPSTTTSKDSSAKPS